MSFLKSAREIAVEKAEKIGRLSEEERRQLKEQEVRQAGAAVAEKYLMSGDERVLVEALERCSAEERGQLGRMVLEWLLRSVELKAPGRLEVVVRGIERLPGAEKFASGIARMRDVFERYRLAESEVRGRIDREGREELHRLRVGGTAVAGINIRARPEWEQMVRGVAGPFVQELEAVKRELLSAAG
ncbi:MAG: hypothetical protein N3E40_01605 [Dehalococcoidia bacterium]|nr:hypothetical protein [Dehalococcoidia bacterium]